MEFAPWEKAVLAIVQDNLPDSLTPYADIAKACSVREEEVLNLLQRLKESGVIRRFGASIRHQKSGWSHNAMVAWLATPEMAEICGPLAASHPNVSHAYYRPSPAGDWPYTFYTMIHGRSEAECLDVVAKLRDSWPVKDYVILRTLRELKKTSMRYFNS